VKSSDLIPQIVPKVDVGGVSPPLTGGCDPVREGIAARVGGEAKRRLNFA
jgi:hypothetical protein